MNLDPMSVIHYSRLNYLPRVHNFLLAYLLLVPQVMVSSIAAMFVAGRFGLAPSSNRVASAGLNLSARETGQDTRDPAGFTGADVLAFGATGHILGAGIVLALKYLGAI